MQLQQPRPPRPQHQPHQAASGRTFGPYQATSGRIRPHHAASGKQHQPHPSQQRQLQQPRQPRPQHQPHRAASGRTPAAAAPAEPISGEPLLHGISPTAITAIEAMPSAASDSMVAAVSSTHQQIGASPSASSSAALCTGLSSTRHDGEPLSQGISPATLTAITAVPSAASDGLVIASTVQVPVGGKVNRPAAAPAEPISGEPISAGASLATITAIEAMPSAAPDGMVIAGSLTQQHIRASRSASSSAALCTSLSSARHDGEPLSQGISPTTLTAITAVPSAASDGLVIASTVQLPVGGKVNRPIDATRTDAIVIWRSQLSHSLQRHQMA